MDQITWTAIHGAYLISKATIDGTKYRLYRLPTSTMLRTGLDDSYTATENSNYVSNACNTVEEALAWLQWNDTAERHGKRAKNDTALTAAVLQATMQNMANQLAKNVTKQNALFRNLIGV